MDTYWDRPWLMERAKLLHMMCEQIACDIAHDMSYGRAYRNGMAFFKRSPLAKRRHLKLSLSTCRGHYRRWKDNPSPNVFHRRVFTPDNSKLSPEMILNFGRRALEGGHSVRDLYDLLKAEVPLLDFSLITLYRALPCEEINAVHAAEAELLKLRVRALDALHEAVKAKGTRP